MVSAPVSRHWSSSLLDDDRNPGRGDSNQSRRASQHCRAAVADSPNDSPAERSLHQFVSRLAASPAKISISPSPRLRERRTRISAAPALSNYLRVDRPKQVWRARYGWEMQILRNDDQRGRGLHQEPHSHSCGLASEQMHLLRHDDLGRRRLHQGAGEDACCRCGSQEMHLLQHDHLGGWKLHEKPQWRARHRGRYPVENTCSAPPLRTFCLSNTYDQF